MKVRMLALLLTVLTLLTLTPLQGVFTVPAEAVEWTTNYRIWSQSDPLWGSMKIGSKTMSSVGCLVTAVAKLMVHAGQRSPEEFNPAIALTEMKERNIFHGTDSMYTGMLADSYFATYAPELTEVYNSGTLSRPMTEAQAAENFRTFIDNGYYIIVMTNTVRNTTHWMTVDDVVNGHVMVMDNRAVIDLYDAGGYNGVARYLLVKYSGDYAYPASAGIKKPGAEDPIPETSGRSEIYTSPDQLRIRSTPSLSGPVIGGLAEGERITIREVKVADGYVWGRIDMGGWCAISLCTYVSGALYEIAYDGNGGTGAPGSQENPYGQAVTLSSDTPKRSGNTFLGWATNPNATAPEYAPGDSVNVDSDLTLYAIWGSGSGTDRSETYTAPDLLRVRSQPSLSASKLSNLAAGTQVTIYEVKVADGYTWGRLANGGWCAISLCTYVSGALYEVTYNGNGGTGAPGSQKNPYGQAVKLTSDRPARSGYTFLGWATTPDATTPEYSPGDSVNVNADLTLYAVWENVQTTGRSETYTAPDLLRVRSQPSLSGTKLSNLAAGTQVTIYEVKVADGYTWGRLANGGWCAISLCTYVSGALYEITYDGNGGTGVPGSQKNRYGQAVTLSSDRPAKTGRTFLGWATSPDATTPEYAPGESVNVNADLTLYAVWDSGRSETYTAPDLLRVRRQPSLSGAKLSNLAAGTQVTIYDIRIAEGYTWGQLSNGGWCAISICTYVSGSMNYILYNQNGGTGGVIYQQNPTDQSVTISAKAPTREGYTFKGYATSPNGTPAYKPGDSVKVNADLSLYAIWSKN